MDREQGFEEVIRKEFPKIQIVARQFGQSDRAKARAAAENFLAAHPDLKGIFASAEPSSVGASLAIKARGVQSTVALVGFDSSESLIEDLKEGSVDALVVQDPFKIGFEAVRTIADRLNGKEPPKRMDLSARVVNKADLDKAEVRKLLLMEEKK
jgi:ribose transport system substrate-binding protein